MKTTVKKIVLMSVAFAGLTSCNRNEDPAPAPTPSSGVLPKKITRTFSNYPGQTSEVTYTYDGNKLKEINISPKEDVSKAKFTYTGDNITKIETFAGPNFSVFNTMTLEYTNDKLSKTTTTPPNGAATVYNYAYNADGSVTKSSPVSGWGTVKYTLVSGNVNKIEAFASNGTLQSTDTFTYDSKNNIHKNITGLSKVLDIESIVWNLIRADSNNTTAITGIMSSTYTYEYNADNYPTKRVETRGTSVTTNVITY